VNLANNKIKIKTEFVVVDTPAKPIFGLADCRKLKYIKNVSKLECLVDKEKERFVNKNNDVFTGMGSFPDQVVIKLSKEANKLYLKYALREEYLMR